MISSINNVSSKFRHYEIVPASQQRTGNRNERVSPAMHFHANRIAILHRRGYYTNLQRITGISGVVRANFYVDPYYGQTLGYFPDDPSLRVLLFMSFKEPQVYGDDIIWFLRPDSKTHPMVPSGNVTIQTFDDGKVRLFRDNIIPWELSRICLQASPRALFASIKINYNGGGMNPNTFYWLRSPAVYDKGLQCWEFYLKDVRGYDVPLTNSSGTTDSALSTLFNQYFMAEGVDPFAPLAGTPIRGSWTNSANASTMSYVRLEDGDNFIDVANGLYIWFRTGLLLKGGNATWMEIYNQDFNEFRSPSNGQSGLLCDRFYFA